MKFKHSREQHLGECTVCHINITKAATLRVKTGRPNLPVLLQFELPRKASQ
jgi:hypothetical protein